MKLTLFGWGFSVDKYCMGGISNPITWCWRLTLHWKLYNFRDKERVRGWWWHNCCFYSAYQYPATPKQVNQYLRRILPILEQVKNL